MLRYGFGAGLWCLEPPGTKRTQQSGTALNFRKSASPVCLNLHYQAAAKPYLGRTCTGWNTPACLAHGQHTNYSKSGESRLSPYLLGFSELGSKHPEKAGFGKCPLVGAHGRCKLPLDAQFRICRLQKSDLYL